ncbi:ArsR/SmtB family transcription factor [Rubrobacter taiwanensis]|uniref:ArsR/SmtB family transcription factor n=1 Tax=Rubrobacter taiwanensis TaxID=185139 RepID=UPI001A9E3EBB|nr:metalloregulator ArsR/SmtB family transcription factor [Rubrobacter taiwanensis]
MAEAPIMPEERVEKLVALGRAISDPIRVRMLAMMAAGRGCCGFAGGGVPARGEGDGICVCEFVTYFGMAQSKVSYHLGRLKEAGLVREEKRGRWSFYSLNRPVAQELVRETAGLLQVPAPRNGSSPGGEVRKKAP